GGSWFRPWSAIRRSNLCFPCSIPSRVTTRLTKVQSAPASTSIRKGGHEPLFETRRGSVFAPRASLGAIRGHPRLSRHGTRAQGGRMRRAYRRGATGGGRPAGELPPLRRGDPRW